MTTDGTAQAVLRSADAALDMNVLFDALEQPMVLFLGDTTISSANIASTATFGVPKDLLLGRHFLDFLHPNEHVQFLATLEALNAKIRSAAQVRLQIVSKDERMHFINGVIRRYATKDRTVFALIAHNDAHGADASAAEVHALELLGLFAQISDVIERRDGRGNYLYVSPGVNRVLGYDQRELMALDNALDLVHPDDVNNVRLSFRTLNTPGATTTLTYRIRHRDGHWLWLESRIRAPLIDPDGVPAEVTAVSRDITARKRVEEELTAAYARAEAASATKSRFLANMSHELRTPLNAIIGFSDIIRRELFGAIGTARYKEYAQLIHDSGGHLLDLINDILDMSKIEAGKFDLRFEAIDLEDIVHSSLKLLEPRAGEAKLVLNAESSAEKPYVQADRRAIKQILLNLLANAIKFTPPGGVITVSLEARSDGAVMQVRDTGIGIAEKDLARVTLPFEQATHDPLLAHGGSGLGLALVQSLVNLHMGTLKIDSVPGQGTCVTVFLPGDPRSRQVA